MELNSGTAKRERRPCDAHARVVRTTRTSSMQRLVPVQVGAVDDGSDTGERVSASALPQR